MNGETTATRTGGMRLNRSLGTDLHDFTPALQHKKIPDARPAHVALRPLVTFPKTIHRSRFENSGASEPVGGEGILHHVAQIVRKPSLERKRECALPPRRQIREERGRH